MELVRQNSGTCSRSTQVQIFAEGIIQKVEVVGGCNGNLKGLKALLEGMSAQDAIARMRGIRCGDRATSCPEQIAFALEEALAQGDKSVSDNGQMIAD